MRDARISFSIFDWLPVRVNPDISPGKRRLTTTISFSATVKTFCKAPDETFKFLQFLSPCAATHISPCDYFLLLSPGGHNIRLDKCKMGKCGSKTRLKNHNVKISDNAREYDYKSQLEKVTQIGQEAEELVKKGNLDDAFWRYRASCYIMMEFSEKGPKTYKEKALEYGSFCRDMMAEINVAKGNTKSTECQDKRGSSLSQFVGQDEVAQKILKMLKRSKTAQTHGYRRQDPSIFLYGPPGSGKTHMAEGIARELGLEIRNVKCVDIYSKFSGESEKKLNILFEEAAKNNTCLFFDQLHALSGNDSQDSSEACERVCTDFLKLMDNKPPGLMVIGATNEPWKVKATVLRRFSKKYSIPLPDEQMRTTLIKHFISETKLVNLLTNDEVRKCAQKIEGYTPNDIRLVIEEAEGLAWDAVKSADYFRPIKLQGGQVVYLPCYSKEEGAIKTKDTQCPGRVYSAIGSKFMNQALKDIKKTEISEEHMQKLKKFN